MRTRFLALLPAIALLTGCQTRLPNVRAGEIHQTVSFPGVSSTVDGTGLRITDTKLIAADASWRLSVLGFTMVTTAKDFEQRRPKEETP